jgi:hypothetical protein
MRESHSGSQATRHHIDITWFTYMNLIEYLLHVGAWRHTPVTSLHQAFGSRQHTFSPRACLGYSVCPHIVHAGGNEMATEG